MEEVGEVKPSKRPKAGVAQSRRVTNLVYVLRKVTVHRGVFVITAL
jgi:hypothetical protein